MSATTPKPTPTGNRPARLELKRRMTTALSMKRRTRRARHELPAPDVFDHVEREPDRICQLPAGIK